MSYYELISNDFYRYADQEWQEMIKKGENPKRPDWTNIYIADSTGTKLQKGRELPYETKTWNNIPPNPLVKNFNAIIYPIPLNDIAYIIIDVEKGTGEASTLTYSGSSKEDIQYIGSDIRHIKNQPLSLKKTGVLFFNSTAFYLWILFPLFVFIFLVIFWKKRTERRANILLMKNRKATKIARKRLKKANDFLKSGKQEDFYEEISRALWGYLSDKFGISLAELSIKAFARFSRGSSRSGNDRTTFS